MSENLELTKRMYEALGDGDIETVLAAMDEEIVWNEATGFPTSNESGEFHGPEAVLEGVLGYLGTVWDDFAVVPERFIDGDETVVVEGTYSGVGIESGTAFEAPFAHVWDFEAGSAVRFRQHTDTHLVQQSL